MTNVLRLCGSTLLATLMLGCQSVFNSGVEYESGGNSATGARLGAIINPIPQGAASSPQIGGSAPVTTLDPDDAEELARIQEEEREQVATENARLMQELQNRGIDVRESERGVVINLPDILFQSGKSELTQAARDVVGEIAVILKTAPRRFIAVEGHTDSLGTIEYNYRLSDARARGVVSDLEASGIPARLITMRAFGETTPIASNKSEQGRMRNRRVEVIIENKWSAR